MTAILVPDSLKDVIDFSIANYNKPFIVKVTNEDFMHFSNVALSPPYTKQLCCATATCNFGTFDLVGN